MKYTFLTLLVLFIIVSCNRSTKNPESPLVTGRWTLVFDVSDSTRYAAIPVRMEVDEKGQFTLINGEERIHLSHQEASGDTLVARIEPYLSSLHYVIKDRKNIIGYWIDEARENYKVNFTAAPTPPSSASDIEWENKTYEVTFSYDCEDCAYKSVGIFNANNGVVSGTFLTETGDYRYLQGETYENGNFYLSCFDGAHLFHFTGMAIGDSIKNGIFKSGKHHSELWNAALNPNAKLRDPDSLTYLKPGYDALEFTVRNINGDSVHFNKEKFLGKTTVVQILGTWCPNCSDETIFWKDVKKTMGDDLQIIPVAFERGSAFEKHVKAVSNYRKQFDLPYEVFVGGEINKNNAAQVFKALNAVMSYPTSIIIDPTGRVKTIHTGFYGPSTGKYHKIYTDRLRREVGQ